MKWIGITGGIGSGKSTVSELLKSKGWPLVDADELARQVTALGSTGFTQVAQKFGPQIIDASGNIDRLKLGQIVFQNPHLRLELEKIIHPLVQERVKIQKDLFEKKSFPFAFYDVPLLFEKKLEKQFDKIILVYCTVEQQFERLKKKTNLSDNEIRNRISSQIPIDQKKNLADFIIDNSGNLDQLNSEIIRLELFLK